MIIRLYIYLFIYIFIYLLLFILRVRFNWSVFARQMHSTSEFAKMFLSKCVGASHHTDSAIINYGT